MQPLQQARQRGLAAAARAHQRHHLAWPDPQAHVAQYRRALGVREADVTEFDVALQRRRLQRVGQIGHQFVLVEHAEDGIERHGGFLQRLVHRRQPLHRPEQPADVAEEGHQRADRELAARHQRAADSQRRQARQRCGEAAEGIGAGVGPRTTLHDRVAVALPGHEALHLAFLAHERLHGADAAEHLAQARVQSGPVLEQASLARRLLARRARADHRRQRSEEEHQHAQPRLERPHRDQREHEVDERRQHREGDVAERTDETRQRLIHRRHGAADARLLMVRERQARELAHHLLAHLQVDAEPHAPGGRAQSGRRQHANALQQDQTNQAAGHRLPEPRSGEAVEQLAHDERLGGVGGGEQERQSEQPFHLAAERVHESECATGERPTARPLLDGRRRTVGRGGRAGHGWP